MFVSVVSIGNSGGIEMNLQKINPWNRLDHEYDVKSSGGEMPIKQNVGGKSLGMLPSQNSLLWFYRDIAKMYDDFFDTFDIPKLYTSFPINQFMEHNLSNLYGSNIDMSGDEKTYQITLDVPGLSKSDITIEVSGDMMTIKGEREEESESGGKQFSWAERSYGSFRRTLSLPEDADIDDIKANLNEGVLKLEIPRNETERPDVKHISISS